MEEYKIYNTRRILQRINFKQNKFSLVIHITAIPLKFPKFKLSRIRIIKPGLRIDLCPNNNFYFRNSRVRTGCFRANNSLNHKLTDAFVRHYPNGINWNVTAAITNRSIERGYRIVGGRGSNDRQKEETGSTTGHEHVLLSILAINARYSVYLMTVLVQFLRERERKKKRGTVNLDAKSLLNGSWQTMRDVNLFILLRMYQASCIISLPRVLRFITFYGNFMSRYSMSFVRHSNFFLFIFNYSNTIIFVYNNFIFLVHHYSICRFFKFRAHEKY